jgi:hypothetical protein
MDIGGIIVCSLFFYRKDFLTYHGNDIDTKRVKAIKEGFNLATNLQGGQE